MAYAVPSVSDFLERFPEFDDLYLNEDDVEAAITRANRSVDETWTEGDFAEAIMNLAAHYFQYGADQAASGGQGGGIASESIGGVFSVSYGRSSGAEKTSEMQTTTYGVEFLRLRRLNISAIRVI